MSQRQEMGTKYYMDIDITFCRWRSLSLSIPSLTKINFFPPIILPQFSSNGRTNRVSQSSLREPGFFRVTEPSYVRNRNSISEFQTYHCTYRVKLILWHLLSYLFVHVSLPLVLEAFSITSCLFFHGLSFSLLWFPCVFQNWSAILLPALSWQLSGWVEADHY